MNQFKPQYHEGVRLENRQTNETYVILKARYNKDKCDIEYKMQKQRYRFDMFWLTETQIEQNVREGTYTQID